MALAEGKNRYPLSLTTANVEKLRESFDILGLPRSALSHFVDEMIEETMVPLFTDMARKKLEGKQLTFVDVFRHVGAQMEKLGEDLDTLK